MDLERKELENVQKAENNLPVSEATDNPAESQVASADIVFEPKSQDQGEISAEVETPAVGNSEGEGLFDSDEPVYAENNEDVVKTEEVNSVSESENVEGQVENTEEREESVSNRPVVEKPKKSKGPVIVLCSIVVLAVASAGALFVFKDKLPFGNNEDTPPPPPPPVEDVQETPPPVVEHAHSWETGWSNDAVSHWHNCLAEDCDITDDTQKDGYGQHVYSEETDESCDTCGYVRVIETPEPEIITDQNFQGILKDIKDDCIIVGNSGMTLAFYHDDIAGVLGEIKLEDEVSIVYSISNDENLLDSITLVTAFIPFEENQEPVEPEKTIEDIFSDFGEELAIIQGREDKDSIAEDGGVTIPDSEKIETMELPFSVEGSGPLWFRFAWKTNKETSIVPGVHDIIVELRTPSGSLVTPNNIDKYGRYWIENGIINYVLKNGRAGNYAFMVTKNGDQRLGDVSSQVVPLTGFITLDKADVAYLNGNLCAIWNVSGVRDDYVSITIKAKRADVEDAKEVIIYSGNTLDDGIHLIDMVELPNSKLNSGVYNFTITAQDIDVQTVNGKTGISAKTMTHTIEIPNVEITKKG